MSLIGASVSHYRVIEKLGGGGMGIVYEAEDMRLGRRVALKFLPAEMSKDPHAVERFQREARAASALNHPGICTIYDIGAHDGQHYIVMERLEGETLKHHTGAARLDIDKIADVGIQIADALDAAHGKGIVHRDIKPANVFYTRRGQAKILDFGLAKLTAAPAGNGAPGDEAEPTLSRDDPLSSPGMALGTMAYMSPEQARGEDLDPRTDLFSFGVVLYELVTGRQAFSGRTSAVIFDAILHSAPVAPVRLNPNCPPELEHIINKALEKDRSLRYQSAAEMHADLKRMRRDSGSGATVAASGRTSAVRRLAGNRYAWAGAGTLIAAIAVVALLLNSRRAPALTERDSIVLADFVNTTGEPVFDGTLRRALVVQMEQSPYLHVVGDEQTQRVLRLMGRSPDERLTNAIAREVCQRGGVKAMLAGSIASLGRNYVIDLQATNCRTGDSLAHEQREAESRETVIQTLGQAASALRGKLGESMASVQKFDTPADDATTSSLDALKAYSLAEDTSARASSLESIPFYKKAIELDPNFALALARLGAVYANSEQELGKEYLKKAFALRDRVSEHERLYIDTYYYRHVTGELDKEIESLELYRRTYPRDFTASNSLTILYAILGQPEKALAAAEEALRLEANSQVPFGNLASTYRRVGRWDEAKAVCRKAEAQKLDGATCHSELYRIAFLEGDEPEMRRHVDWARGNAVEHSMRRFEASAAALRGRFTAARRLAREGVDMAMQRKLKQTAAASLVFLGLLEAHVGNASLARKNVAEALAIDRSGERLIAAAHVLGISGDAAQASALVEEANRKMPSTNMLFHAIDLPVAQAAIHLTRGAPAKSLDTLKPGAPYERGRFAIYGGVYLRGLAHLEAGHGAEAASDFERILHNKDAGGPRAMPIWPALAHVGLARAAALSGDTAKSRRAYQDFLAYWKDADPDVPILIEAKAEYAKLGS